MILIGNYNDLRVLRRVDFGLYLIDEEGTSEVLLPQRYVTSDMDLDTAVRVFVYHDSEGRPVATTEEPLAVVGDFALMRVKAVNAVGAFLDWGLVAKDLLVPFREQRVEMVAGRSYVVRVYLDDATGRVVATTKLGRFLKPGRPRYYHRQRVEVLIVQRTDLGYRVIINDEHWGQIYQKEIYQEVNVGERYTAFVQKVRDDGKVDVTLLKIERMRIDDVGERILDHLRANGGSMPFTDRSTPEEILQQFGCSKKDFKKSLGLLYRQRLVTLGDRTTLTRDGQKRKR